MDRKEIARILGSAEGGGLRPRHAFGQHFMVDERVLRALVEAGEVGEGDVVLEVGPGVGNLTRLLAERVGGKGGGGGRRGAVLAVDIDRKLMAAAQRHHAETGGSGGEGGGGEGGMANVTWMHADVLAGKHRIEPRVLAKLRELRAEHGGGAGGELKLVSNLPYNAASPVVAELLVEMWKAGNDEIRMTNDESNPNDKIRSSKSEIRDLKSESRKREAGVAGGLMFSRMAFTVQWEVGMRMTCERDTRDYGPLGILMQSMAEVEIVRKIGAGAFWPPPKVQSALVVVKPAAERMRGIRDAIAWQGFLSGIFGHRRQTLGNALKHYYGEKLQAGWKEELAVAGFDLKRRPENLGIEELVRLEGEMEKQVARSK